MISEISYSGGCCSHLHVTMIKGILKHGRNDYTVKVYFSKADLSEVERKACLNRSIETIHSISEYFQEELVDDSFWIFKDDNTLIIDKKGTEPKDVKDALDFSFREFKPACHVELLCEEEVVEPPCSPGIAEEGEKLLSETISKEQLKEEDKATPRPYNSEGCSAHHRKQRKAFRIPVEENSPNREHTCEMASLICVAAGIACFCRYLLEGSFFLTGDDYGP